MTQHILLSEGKKAPQFTLADTEETGISLKDFAGKWVVLYFYPKDNTSGCTIEAVDFSTALPYFRKHNAEIIGISPDSCKSHQGFIAKHNLAVTLLSDPDKVVLEKYGVWQKKKMYGKEYYGVVRTTMLIDPDGKIVKIWSKVNVKGHVDEVKKVLSVLT